jgi:hypothetical protein
VKASSYLCSARRLLLSKPCYRNYRRSASIGKRFLRWNANCNYPAHRHLIASRLARHVRHLFRRVVYGRMFASHLSTLERVTRSHHSNVVSTVMGMLDTLSTALIKLLDHQPNIRRHEVVSRGFGRFSCTSALLTSRRKTFPVNTCGLKPSQTIETRLKSKHLLPNDCPAMLRIRQTSCRKIIGRWL